MVYCHSLSAMSVTHCDLIRDEVAVTFSDGYTYAFTAEFLHASRLRHGQFVSVDAQDFHGDPKWTETIRDGIKDNS
jgi:hypothetical protein